MIKINKSPEPAELAAERSKASGTYRHEAIVSVIKKDFYNRCYLCEDRPQSINIEHLKPHRNDLGLLFSWENLFWSCGHCNNIKLAKYDDIIDCVSQDDVEDVLIYKFDPFPTEDVCIEIASKYKDSVQAMQTKNLLLDIFNGTTVLKSIESNSLRKKIALDLITMQRMILDLDDDNKSEEELRDIRVRIISALSPRSLFASFKRCKVRSVPGLVNHLKKYIPELQL